MPGCWSLYDTADRAAISGSLSDLFAASDGGQPAVLRSALRGG
jgi:hypothetical protein